MKIQQILHFISLFTLLKAIEIPNAEISNAKELTFLYEESEINIGLQSEELSFTIQIPIKHTPSFYDTSLNNLVAEIKSISESSNLKASVHSDKINKLVTEMLTELESIKKSIVLLFQYQNPIVATVNVHKCHKVLNSRLEISEFTHLLDLIKLRKQGSIINVDLADNNNLANFLAGLFDIKELIIDARVRIGEYIM